PSRQARHNRRHRLPRVAKARQVRRRRRPLRRHLLRATTRLRARRLRPKPKWLLLPTSRRPKRRRRRRRKRARADARGLQWVDMESARREACGPPRGKGCRMNPKRVVTLSLAALLGTTGLACAARERGAPGAGLTSQTSGGIRYLAGGVSEEERDAIREQANGYNLWIWLARSGSGYFLADVKVSIVDARGQPVLDTVTNGPWLLARVPPG